MRYQWYGGQAKAGVFAPVFNVPLTIDGGGSNVTICELINGPFSKNGSKVRLTLQASSVNTYPLNNLWAASQGVGNPYDFDGTQVQFTAGGIASFTVPSFPATIVTDAINYNFIAGNNFVVAYFGPPGGGSRESSGIAGVTRYFGAAGVDSASATSKPAGFTSGAGILDLITKIEVFG